MLIHQFSLTLISSHATIVSSVFMDELVMLIGVKAANDEFRCPEIFYHNDVEC